MAITPRSGSSFLCDVLKKTKALGTPQEFLNQEFIPKYLAKKIPAKTPDAYLDNILSVSKTNNGVAGIKASWYQFRNFQAILENQSVVSEFKYIYLTRPNTALQAVSLYKATESTVFHSTATHGEDALNILNDLKYDFEKIDYWYRHILAQEEGWRLFFAANNISPLSINYDVVSQDWLTVAKQIAVFVGLKQPGLKTIENRAALIKSNFEKIGDLQSAEWAKRFADEKQTTIGNLEKPVLVG